jgi:hypothetical protein
MDTVTSDVEFIKNNPTGAAAGILIHQVPDSVQKGLY